MGITGSDGMVGDVVDANGLGERLAELHRRVTDGRLRVEITCDGSDERCVMLTKAELDSLEEALEILSHGHAYKGMSESVSQLAAATQF
ncbi:MAG TPA: hypothetical protein VK324_04825 [Tepidisphaeraceae bacterium]|nr:hypothetical protein [Tepidisphaeraceae bacterium]